MNDTENPITTAPSDTATKTIAKKRLVVFLAVTFVLTWGLDIVAGIMLGAYENGEMATPAIVAPIAISMFFPLLGAIAANWACGTEHPLDLGLHPRIKSNVRFYLAAWFAPAFITLAGCVVFFAVNPQLFDPTLSSYLETTRESIEAAGGAAAAGVPTEQEFASAMPMVIAASIVSALTVAPFINAIPAFGEEAGWRGMLLPTLCELMPVRSAVIVSGIIWGLWHAPIIEMGHNYGMDYPGFPWAGILVMTVACTAFGAWLSYLRLRTQSVWPCALAHGALNAVANIGVAFCVADQTLAGPSPLGCIAGIPLFIFGIICWLKTDIDRMTPRA